MSCLPRRKGTLDRTTDGVGVVLVEEGGETAEEVHIDEEHLPEDVREGDTVSLTHRRQYTTPADVLVVAGGAVAVFVGSVVLTTASPLLPAGPVVDLPSETASVVANAFLGAVLMTVGVRAALPSLDRLLTAGTTRFDSPRYFSVERLGDETDETRRRITEKTESLSSRRRKTSEFETDGGKER